jgi:hypothetical protein
MNGVEPILPGSPLGRALCGERLPELPVDFTDRVLAATRERAAPLPELRRSGGGGLSNGSGARRWRSARRLGFAALGAGALASAAAAAGLLDNLPVALPSAAQVWGAITGEPPHAAASPQATPAANAGASTRSLVPREDAKTQFEGTINTPEELEATFRKIDEAREDRKATRREKVDRRINEVLERRRAQGLRTPTPEQEARLRKRLEQARARADTQVEREIEQRRESLRERVQSGEQLTPEDFRPDPDRAARKPGARQRLKELRQLPPAQRRERIEELREQRRQRIEGRSEPQVQAPEPVAPAPAPEASEKSQ